MSELIAVSNFGKLFRWQLLASASSLALVTTLVTNTAEASDKDASRPTVWIELGGQLEGLDANEESFAPSFLFASPRPVPETTSPLNVEGPPGHSFGGEGKVIVQPQNSSWIFSAAVRFGRSNAKKHLHQQSYQTQGIPKITPPLTSNVPLFFRQAQQFSDGSKKASETHTIIDFQAGRDVGLGIFGAGSASILNFGVRFAEFGSKSNIAFKSDPDAHPSYLYFGSLKIFPSGGIYHSNMASASATRSFRGVGPSLSWNASAPLLGTKESGEVTLDWGLNAAVLFGRQKARVHHQTTALYHQGKYAANNPPVTLYRNTPPDQLRSRSVVAPNIGGFAGVSFNYGNGKVSFGYRADFFLGAEDGGIDARKRENADFYGPFASVSVGL